MKNVKLVYIPLLLSIACVLGVYIGSYFDVASPFNETANFKHKQKLNTLLQLIDKKYVDDVNTDSIVDVAIGNIISDLDPIKVDFTAPEQYIGRLAPGQTVEAFSVAWPERTFEGEIVSLSPIVNPVTRAAQIRAIIKTDDLALRPGMLLEIKINLGQAEALTVKESALIPLGEKQFAFQVVDGIAKRKEVSIGRRFPGKVEITSGLSEGDVVITEGFRAIPGMPVNVTQPEDVYTVGQEGS